MYLENNHNSNYHNHKNFILHNNYIKDTSIGLVTTRYSNTTSFIISTVVPFLKLTIWKKIFKKHLIKTLAFLPHGLFGQNGANVLSRVLVELAPEQEFVRGECRFIQINNLFFIVGRWYSTIKWNDIQYTNTLMQTHLCKYFIQRQLSSSGADSGWLSSTSNLK